MSAKQEKADSALHTSVMVPCFVQKAVSGLMNKGSAFKKPCQACAPIVSTMAPESACGRNFKRKNFEI